MDWLELGGKVAIVTGGALGIGNAIATGLAEAGAHLVIADMNPEAGQKAASALTEQFGGSHIFVETNVANKESVEQMVRAAMETFGKVDILVNNAGVCIPRLLVDPQGKEELTEDVWDKSVGVNQKGFFLCAQAAAREMIRAGSGVIINMSSESGLEGSEGQSVYASTKAAAYSLTRSWAKELGKYGIRVVGIAPGIVETTALRTEAYERSLAYTRGITLEKLREVYEKASTPLGRIGTLKEIANAVCFLSSPRAGYIHGTILNISGGKSRG